MSALQLAAFPNTEDEKDLILAVEHVDFKRKAVVC